MDAKLNSFCTYDATCNVIKADLVERLYSTLQKQDFKLSHRRAMREVDSILEAMAIFLSNRHSVDLGAFVIAPYKYRRGADFNIKVLTEGRGREFAQRCKKPFEIIGMAAKVGSEKHRKVHITSMVFIQFVEELIKAMNAGCSVELRGLGTFSNDAENVPMLKPSKRLKARINERQRTLGHL